MNEKTKLLKIKFIETKFREIMKDGLDLDMNDASLKDTPVRVAKMYINEIFSGLDGENFPKVTTFPNDSGYNQIIGMYNQTIFSMCEHHFLPFKMNINIGYIPSKEGRIIGASKLIRVAKYFARRPQVQERLANNIAEYLEKKLKSLGVIVYITKGEHLCVQMRGVENTTSEFVTSEVRGTFLKNPHLEEKFLRMIK